MCEILSKNKRGGKTRNALLAAGADQLAKCSIHELTAEGIVAITPQQAAEFALADIRSQPNIHFARHKNECHFYQICAAHKYGYSEPFSTEEVTLNAGLSKLHAGKERTLERPIQGDTSF